MEKLTKGKQIFLYVAPFPALAFFKIWAASERAPGTLLLAACALLVYGIMVIALAYRWDKPSYFDWSTTAYFGFAASGLFFWPETMGNLLTRYAVTGIYAVLFSAAFFPPLFGKDPFTYHYAKKQTPEIFWRNPIFVRINQIMTAVWSGVFALCLILSIYPSILTRAVVPLIIILGFGLPFNLKFPEAYLKRLGLPSLAEQRRMFARESTDQTHTAGMRLPAAGAPEKPPISQPTGSDFDAVRPDPRTKTPEAVLDSRQSRDAGKEHVMKVLALNSSPRTGGESKTEIMLDALVKGMREAGADVEVVELRKKTVKHCVGCFTCWTKTPGQCIHQDDMSRELFAKWLEADLAVYATPLYHFTVNARMKTFIERTLPVLQPFLMEGQGRTWHPLRHTPPKAVFLSVAGFPEMAVFDQLSAWVRFIFGRKGGLVAEIYRPGAESLSMPQVREKTRAILEATAQAGREIVHSAAVSPETMSKLTQDIVEDKEITFKMVNLMWKTCIAEGLTPKEFMERGLIPRPDSIETFMLILTTGFNPDAASDLNAVLQFHFSGNVEGSCHFHISQGQIQAVPGTAEKPDLTIESPFEVWMDIMTGKRDGQKAFMEGSYSVKGDFPLLLRMREFFGGKG